MNGHDILLAFALLFVLAGVLQLIDVIRKAINETRQYKKLNDKYRGKHK